MSTYNCDWCSNKYLREDEVVKCFCYTNEGRYKHIHLHRFCSNSCRVSFFDKFDVVACDRNGNELFVKPQPKIDKSTHGYRWADEYSCLNDEFAEGDEVEESLVKKKAVIVKQKSQQVNVPAQLPKTQTKKEVKQSRKERVQAFYNFLKQAKK